ncbi:MAG TPA: hypothetical protein VH277_10385 [Gemmatimonadaceae bacterium]|jgi:TolB protein|nr:hypothetical protein [Gemmatimonadaceae bacterium]
MSTRVVHGLVGLALLSSQSAARSTDALPNRLPPIENASPVVSPDGRHIAFSSTRDGRDEIYVMSGDGSSVKRLTNEPSQKGIAGWSADGRRLFYSVVDHDTSTVYSVDVGGGVASRLAIVPGVGARLTHDGSRILYGELPWQSMQLFIAKLDGSERMRLTPGTSAFYCAAFSPDDRRVAVSRQSSELWILDADGGEGAPVAPPFPGDGRPQCPSWSGDGRRIAVQANATDPVNPSKPTGSSHLWMFDTVARSWSRLGEHASPYLDEVPSWFPDGTRLAFQSNRTGSMQIWVMNADETGARQLTK